MSRVSKDKLKAIHCDSFCNFNIGQNIEECKNKCLCPSESISHVNSLDGVKCVEKSVPEGNSYDHLNSYSSVPKQNKAAPAGAAPAPAPAPTPTATPTAAPTAPAAPKN